MKTKNIFLIFAIVAYSCLFYQQTSGLNFLIFDSLMIGFLLIQNPDFVKEKYWLGIAGGVLLSALMIVLYNSGLAIFANIISMILLAGYNFQPKVSLYLAALHGFMAIGIGFCKSALVFVEGIGKSSTEPQVAKGGFSWKKASLYIFPIVITLVFYSLYASANPVFASLIQFPEFHISGELLAFTFGGWVLLIGFFRPDGSMELVNLDKSQLNGLQRVKLKIKKNFGILSLKFEQKIGVLSLLMLNVLLLIFIATDVYFILLNGRLPAGVDFSEYLHQGVETLVFSIVLAIGLILYFFRKNQNFYSQNQRIGFLSLKSLTYIWILQNMVLVLSIIHKNQLYIHEFGLTYKRIGVYVYLFLTLAGLITTFIKVQQLKTFWFLLRKNTWIAYIVLTVSCLVNWDRFIAHYNINYAKQLDVVYLLNLSDTVLPDLVSLQDNPKVNLRREIRDYTNPKDENSFGSTPISMNDFITNQKQYYLQRTKLKSWQSWSYDDLRIQESLNFVRK